MTTVYEGRVNPTPYLTADFDQIQTSVLKQKLGYKSIFKYIQHQKPASTSAKNKKDTRIICDDISVQQNLSLMRFVVFQKILICPKLVINKGPKITSLEV